MGLVRSATCLFVLVLCTGVQAADKKVKYTPGAKTQEEVVRYVERASELVLQLGPDKAFPVLTDPEGPWVDGEWYLFASDFDGYIVAHINKKFIGPSFLGIRDIKGNAFLTDLQRIGHSEEGRGWSVYWWPPAGSTVPGRKASYIMRVPGMEIWIGAGAYGLSDEDIERVTGRKHGP